MDDSQADQKTQENPNIVRNLGQIATRMRTITSQSSFADSSRSPAAVHSTSVASDHGFVAGLPECRVAERARKNRRRGDASGSWGDSAAQIQCIWAEIDCRPTWQVGLNATVSRCPAWRAR